MSTGFEFSAAVRSTTGKAAARRMRHANEVPAIIYGAGKDPQPITLGHDMIFHALNREAFHSSILDVNLDNGQKEKVVVKDIQRHVFKPKIEHVDFQRINATEKLTMHIPIHYLGEEEAEGIKEGGVLSKLMTDIEVKCLPADLPSFFEVDVTNLGMEQSLHISDIKLPSGVEFAQHDLDEAHDHPIVNIHPPKVIKEDVDAEVAAEEEAKAEAVEGEEVAAAEGEEKPAEGKSDADKSE